MFNLKKIIFSILIGGVFGAFLIVIFNYSELSLQNRMLFSNQPYSYKKAVKRAAPAVVNVYSLDVDPEQEENLIHPLGSGVIMSQEGYIITNYHVISGQKNIIVALQDGRIYESKLVGIDELIDIAVLKINAENLPVIPINPNRKPHVGDVVLAIGNPYNIGQTITQGIISATGRDSLSPYRKQNFIQTDAAINRGNSGGALVNSLGELVGINTLSSIGQLFYDQSMNISDGISFAIPTTLATKIMNQIIKNGKIIRGYIGIDGKEISLSDEKNKQKSVGILVTKTDNYANSIGLQPGDILLAINNKPIISIIQTMEQISDTKPGTELALLLLRERKEITLKIFVGIHPGLNPK